MNKGLIIALGLMVLSITVGCDVKQETQHQKAQEGNLTYSEVVERRSDNSNKGLVYFRQNDNTYVQMTQAEASKLTSRDLPASFVYRRIVFNTELEVYKNHVYVPADTLRVFGLTVIEDKKQGMVDIVHPYRYMTMKIGDNKAHTSKLENVLEVNVEPMMINNEIYVPVDYVLDVFDIDFEFQINRSYFQDREINFTNQ
jgi:hypothetical protein